MAEKRQKKQAVKAFEKETFSKDKEVTGAKHTEHRQDTVSYTHLDVYKRQVQGNQTEIAGIHTE